MQHSQEHILERDSQPVGPQVGQSYGTTDPGGGSWSVMGGDGQVTISAHPGQTPPIVAGGAGELTITG